MAKKGKKFNKYTEEFKEKILNEYLEGKESARTFGTKYAIPYQTVKTWIYQYRHPELKTGKKQGRPKQEETIDYKQRYEILKKYQTFLKAQREKK